MTEPDRDRLPTGGDGAAFRRQRRGRNLAVLLAILAACALFYIITVVRMVQA